MGLLDVVLGGAREVGAYTEKTADENTRSLIAEDRMKRLEEHRVATQEAATVRGEQRRIENDRTVRGEIFREDVERAPKRREIAVADAKAKKQGEIDVTTDPANVEKIAKATAESKRLEAIAGKDLQAELLKDPKYLANMKTILMAEHPERFAAAAASSAHAAKAQFELGVAKKVQEARVAFGAAQKSGDPEAIRNARDELAALEGTSGRAQQAADSTVITTTSNLVKDMRNRLTQLLIKEQSNKEDLAADPNSPTAKARKSALEATQAEITRLQAEVKRGETNLLALTEQYEKDYGSRAKAKPAEEKPAAPGIANTPKPTAAPSATIEYERDPKTGKLVPKK